MSAKKRFFLLHFTRLFVTLQKTAQNKRRIKSVTLLGSTEAVTWQQTKDALTITKPQAVPSPEAVVFKVTFK